jgi:hypothetical protein
MSNIVEPATASGSSSRTSKKSLPGQGKKTTGRHEVKILFSDSASYLVVISCDIVVISGDNSSKSGYEDLTMKNILVGK